MNMETKFRSLLLVALASVFPPAMTGCGSSDGSASTGGSVDSTVSVPDTVYITDTIVEQVEVSAPAEPSDAQKMGFKGPVKKITQDYWECGDAFFFDTDGNLTRYEGYNEAYSCVVYFSDGVPVSGRENDEGDAPNQKMSKSSLKEYRDVLKTKQVKGPGMKKDRYSNWTGGNSPYSGSLEDENFVRTITYY